MSLQDRLGSLGSVKNEEGPASQKKDDTSDATSPPMLQRTAIIQKDERGYGLTVSGDNPVYVASVKEGGAAEKAGVQTGDKIIKVNGKLVTNSNHTEVVKMIRLGSYVALTLLGKPSSGNRDSFSDRNSSSGSFRDSFSEKITGPQPVDAEKEREVRQQKVNTIRVMYETVHEEYDSLKKAYKNNPSDKLQSQIQDKEKTLKILEAQLQNLPHGSSRDSQVPAVNVDTYPLSSDTSSISSWLPSRKDRKHMKHSSSPGAMYHPSDPQPRSSANVCRSKSDVSTRKNALSEYVSQGYKRTDSSPETGSIPAGVSDLGSESPSTSPSTSPIPTHQSNLDGDTTSVDTGIEDGSVSSVGNTSRASMPIIGMDDDDFASEDESMDVDRKSKSASPFLAKLQSFETGECKVFAELQNVENRPGHMAVFLHYVLNHHNPSSLLFYYLSGVYSTAQGSNKDLKKWAYEIHSTFIIHDAPLKVNNIDDHIIQEIDSILQFRSEKEDSLRCLFNQARSVAQKEVNKLLDDLRQKNEQGLIEGSTDLKDHMEKNEEAKLVDKILSADLAKCFQQSEEDDKLSKQSALSWAIATFLRHSLHKSSSHLSFIERVPSFVTKDKKGSKFSSKQKKGQKGHQFVMTHIYKQEFCLHCNRVLWGVGFQGYQCATCDQCVHKHCIDDLEEQCNKKKKRVSTLGVFKPKTTQATPIITDTDKDQVGSPTQTQTPAVLPLKDAEDKERTAFRDAGHSVNSLVNRFESSSPEKETSGRKGSDLGRSESMKGRGDQRDARPARRSKSDVDMDENTLLRAITTSGSSSASSLRSTESPVGSMDTLTSQINDDSDFDVEPELPSLKQVLGEDTVRKLKPKEKKRQDVINELFYTEKCHVRSLKILDKLFYKPMLKEQSIPQEFTKSLFPNLETMTHLHGSLNNCMKTRRKEKSVISTVGDILLQRFDGEAGENFRNGCAIFCRNQSHALEALKVRVRKEAKMSQLLSDAENNPLCHRLALRDIIPKQFMRLTKYPLLIENLLKYTQTNTEEYTNLERSLQCSKHILEYVNQAVKDCENHQRLIDLQRRIDKKIDNSPEVEDLRTFDLSKHKLLHDGALTWRINNKKQIELHVVLLERAMVLLQKQEERLVLKLQSTQLVAGREDQKRHSPLLFLNNVLARNDATDKRAFFVVNTSKAGPQIYQLVAGTADEQKRWTKYITQASEAMKKSEIALKKKPAPAQTVTPVAEQVSIDENHVELTNIDEGGLVHPDEVTYNDTPISTAVPVISPLDKLRQNDENLAAVLEERQNVIAEILNVASSEVDEKTQEVLANEDSDPTQLISACQHQLMQLADAVKDTSSPNAPSPQPQQQDDPVQPGEQPFETFESIEDMTKPIPMEKLKDMSNRMSIILTNLLAQTRAMSTSEPQAAMNKRDEERDRLRRELKFAQDELNRLRRIQQKQMELNRKEEEEKQGRPASLISEASTVSESETEEPKEESDVTSGQDTDNNEDTISMPGLPIEPEPEIVSELSNTALNEVSPMTIETLPDLDSEEITELKEAEVEEVEEMLHEVEPPEDDEIEDSDTPVLEFVNQSDGSSSDNETESDNNVQENNNVEKLNDSGPGTDVDIVEDEIETCVKDDSVNTDEAVNGEDNKFYHTEERESKSNRESVEVFHDAVDDTENVCDDPGGEPNGQTSDINNECRNNDNNINDNTDNTSTTETVTNAADSNDLTDPSANTSECCESQPEATTDSKPVENCDEITTNNTSDDSASFDNKDIGSCQQPGNCVNNLSSDPV